MSDKFPTAFYESNDALVCPNGDKLRSDDEGTFCWIEGDPSGNGKAARVPAVVVNGAVVLQPVVAVVVAAEVLAPKGGKKKVEAGESDANG